MGKNVILILSIFASLTFACNNNTNSETKNETEEPENVSKTLGNAEKVELKILTFDKEIAKNLAHTGEIVYGKAWTDSNGENIIILSEKQTMISNQIKSDDTRELHAYHYVKTADKYTLIREIKDFENNCEGFNRARFIENTLEITDLDNDGLGEITFVYNTGCLVQMTENIGLKLIMLENGEKYAIRGTANTGETKIDSAFNSAPKAFQEHAKKIWSQNQNPNLSETPRLNKLEKLMKYKNTNLGGVEPNWTVKLFDKYLEFSTNMGENPIRFNYIKIEESNTGNKTLTVHTKKDGNDRYNELLLQITEKKCSDGMSDNEYALTVYVSHAQKAYYGCGSYN